MPENIYLVTPEGQENERIPWLCEGNWQIPDQTEALKAWSSEHRATLTPDDDIADMGFTLRGDACGGGAAIPPDMMGAMADHARSLFLSEYPSDLEGWCCRDVI
jgi:hypothetical protein